MDGKRHIVALPQLLSAFCALIGVKVQQEIVNLLELAAIRSCLLLEVYLWYNSIYIYIHSVTVPPALMAWRLAVSNVF